MDRRTLIQPGIDYIEDNLKAEIRAGELAELAGFSLFHYYRIFQAVVGMPVMRYISRRRLLHAIWVIRCGRTGVEAALDYGFDTYAGFYKAFQREFGCTPQAYLRSNRARRPYRPDLTKEELMIVTHKKARELLTHWGLEDAPLSPIYDEGTGNANEYACSVGDENILKYTTDPEKLRSHLALTEALERAGLLTAAVVKTRDGQPFIQDGTLYAYLTKRIPGHQLTAGALCGEEGTARRLGALLGGLHEALASMDCPVSEVDLCATVRDWALPRAAEPLGLTEEFCRTWLERFIHRCEGLPRQVIHRDPHPGNVIRSAEGWAFIDFELSERNIRLYDPCYAATAVLSEIFADEESREKWPAVLAELMAGYDAAAKLMPREREAVGDVILANQLICVAWFAGQEKYVALLETNLQMTRWLMDVLKL